MYIMIIFCLAFQHPARKTVHLFVRERKSEYTYFTIQKLLHPEIERERARANRQKTAPEEKQTNRAKHGIFLHDFDKNERRASVEKNLFSAAVFFFIHKL